VASCWVSQLAACAEDRSDRGFCLLVVELPQRFIVTGRYRSERPPIEITQQVEPEHVLLGFEVHIVGFDDVDQGDLDFDVTECYHATGPLSVVLLIPFIYHKHREP